MKYLFAIICIITSTILFSQSNMRMTPSTVKSFELPSFDEKTGFTEWEFFGKNAKYLDENNVLVEDMKLELFDGSEKKIKKATFTSDLMNLSPSTSIANGKDKIFVQGENFKIVSQNWLWESKSKKMLLSKDVDIKFENDKDEQTTITSNIAIFTYDGDVNQFEFKDNVLVKGKEFSIICDDLQTFSPKKSKQDVDAFQKITAKKNVKMSQKKVEATAEGLDYNPKDGTGSLYGKPIVIDLDSKASLSGNLITFDKNKSEVVAKSSNDKKIRTTSVIISEDSQKNQSTTIIVADETTMKNHSDETQFDFKKNVAVSSKDFKAYADSLEAIAKKNNDGKFTLNKILGKSDVRLLRDGKSARAGLIEIYPEDDLIILKKNTLLQESKKGISLAGETIALHKKDDRANAFSKQDDPLSFVTVTIMETGNVPNVKTAKHTIIKSKKLTSQKYNEDIILDFSDNVKIDSGDMIATCDTMRVFADSKSDGKSSINKIENFGNVIVKQKASEARAEHIIIYPKAEIKADNTSSQNKFVELLIWDEKPNVRPQMSLPTISGIGLSETPKNNISSKPTVIISDSQSYVNGKDSDKYFFDGNVIITGTDFDASCDKIEVVMKPDKSGEKKIQLIIMTGNIKITQQLKLVSAGRAEILPIEEMITLSENPTIINNEDKTKAVGYKMVYRRGKKSISIEGSQFPQNNKKSDKHLRPTITLPPIQTKK